MAKKIAYAIARESSDDRTLQNQYDSIQKLAKELGYKIVREFGDNISGDASKRDGAFAPFMEELKEAIRERIPDAIFIAALDRLTRTTYEQGYFLTYFSVENRIPMYFAKENVWTIDLATGKLNEKVMSELSSDTTPQKERENIAKRTQAPRAKVGLEGYYIGHLSDGYCVKESWGTYEDGHRRKIKEIIPDDKRRGVIERIFKLYLKGNSTDKIASLLNAENVPTANKYRSENLDKFGYKQKYVGKDKMERERSQATWSGTLIAQVLSNTWYKGVRTFKGKELYHYPLVSVEDWETVKSMREERKVTFRNKKDAPKHMFLLSDLFFCGKCGRKMYGHFTGLNNHYYCSSLENAIEKCGLKGICKENIEAIIYDVISTYAISSVLFDTPNNVVADFFKLDKKKEQEIKEQINYNKKIISKLEEENKRLDESIDFLIQQQTTYKDNARRVERYEAEIVKNEAKIEGNKDKIKEYQAEIRRNNQLLSSSSNIKQILQNIVDNNELSTIRELFKQAIDRVVIYNTEKTNDIIKVSYKNGKVSEIVYSAGLLKGKYIPLQEPLYYDIDLNLITSLNLPIYIAIDNKNYYFVRDYEPTLDNEKMLLNDMEIWQTDSIKIEKGITVDDFIRLLRNTSNALPFERLEEEPEIAKAQREHYREWRKKYNTGASTAYPYVLRNETYEEIEAKRKKLYNRRYKIKKHKSMPLEEKERLLADIKKQLDILSVQVPTFRPRKKRETKHNDEEDMLRMMEEAND